MTVYHVTEPIPFVMLHLPLPPNSAVFWSQGNAGGVLLLPGIHYTKIGTNSFQLTGVSVAAGDTIAVMQTT